LLIVVFSISINLIIFMRLCVCLNVSTEVFIKELTIDFQLFIYWTPWDWSIINIVFKMIWGNLYETHQVHKDTILLFDVQSPPFYVWEWLLGGEFV
jgi:hypothetical protein